jgi:hypothetical protein
LTHIKGAAGAAGDRASMTATSRGLSAQHQDLEALLDDAVREARRADWLAYRTRLRALSAAFNEHMTYEDEELFPALERRGIAAGELQGLRDEHAHFRMQLETLGAAAPEHDPEGCIGELELLIAFQRAHHEREVALCYAHAERLGVAPPPRVVPLAAPLDLRGLQPPEPIVRIFDALERAPFAPVRAILPHEPLPLYSLLRERGFAYSGRARDDGGFEILIEPSQRRQP